MQIFRIEGSTGDEPAGFVSLDLNYSGKKVIFSVGEVSKYSIKPEARDRQIGFTFFVTGKDGHGSALTYVDGSLPIKGWHNNHCIRQLPLIPLISLTWKD